MTSLLQNTMLVKFLMFYALSPSFVRSRLGYRILSRLARNAKMPEYLTGNMGISSRLRCLIPSNDGLLLFGRPKDYCGERGALEVCGVLSKHSNRFIDIGSHKGYFSFFVRASVGNELPIYLFEPDDKLYRILDENIHRNNHDRMMMPFKKAVGSFNGNAVFYRNLTSSLSGSLKDDFKDNHETIESEVFVCSYHSFAQEVGIQNACVKVDIENSEFDFLEGAIESIRTIKFLIMEVLGPAVQQGFIKKMIEAGGFNTYYIDDYDLRHSSDGSFEYHSPQYNWLFCRESPDSLRRTLAGNRKLKVYDQ